MNDLVDDVKKLLGKPPYNGPDNICWNNNYFAQSLKNKYGEAALQREIDRQTKKEKDR